MARCLRCNAGNEWIEGTAAPPEPPEDNFVVPRMLLNRIYNTLLGYANRTTYERPRIGGVLQGCPRGEAATPEQLTFGARMMINEIDRELLPKNKPTDFWPLDINERNELDTLRRRVQELEDGVGRTRR